MTIELVVYGTPAPQGSKRHVGRGIMVESSAKVAPWREAVKWAALSKLTGREPMAGPLHVTCDFFLLKPRSAPKKVHAWPAKRPDLDKLLRSTFDALSDAGVWLDDAQVVRCTASKSYALEGLESLSRPGAVIRVRPLDAA